MAEDNSQVDFQLLSLGNVLLLDQILKNYFAAAANTYEPLEQPPPRPQPSQEVAACKPTEQPLDLSMKANVSLVKDLNFAHCHERLNELHEMNIVDGPFLRQHLQKFSGDSLDTGLFQYVEVGPEQRSMRNSPVLWQFLLKCLSSEECNPSVIEWVCKEEGIFRLTNARLLAQLWGEKKHKPNMSEENLKRSLRYYYGKKILTKVQGHRDVYKFYVNLR